MRAPRRTLPTLVATALLVLLALSAPASAQAESPWWHLTSGARPTYLHKGGGKAGVNETQRVTVKASGGSFVLANMSKEEVTNGQFTCFSGPEEEIETPKWHEFKFNASAAEVQAGLEGVCGYGAGNVEVSGGPGDEIGLTPYNVTFKGELGEKPVRLINTEFPAEFQSEPLEGSFGVSELAAGRPGTSDGEIYVTAENLGDANVDASKTPVRFTDVLPHGLRAVGIAGTKPQVQGDFQEHVPLPCALEESGSRGSCTLNEALAPYDQLEMRIAVEVQPGASTGELNETRISGGKAASASLKRPITISTAPPPFGVEGYEMALEDEGGAPPTQAGTHPFQLTTTLTLNQNADTNPLENPRSNPEVTPAALAKDLKFKLPPGLIGNPTPFPQCTTAQFFANVGGTENRCPPQTAVGVAVATVHEPAIVGTVTLTEPIFNLEPLVGEPARFGFFVAIANAPVLIDTSVRTGGDYGVTVNVNNITQTAGFLSSKVTFWGVPGDPRHDSQRGWGCLYEARLVTPHAPCNVSEEQHPRPFLSLPTSCTAPLQTSVEGDSWAQAGSFLSFPGEFEPIQHLDGCNGLQFTPEIKVAPDGQEASKPTGLKVDVHVPQEVNTNAQGLASSNVKSITVAFPEGVTLNPAAADGLLACSEAQVGLLPGLGAQEELLFTPTLPQAFCPDASKVGTVTIKSPLLPAGQPIEGSLYLATPAPNEEEANNPFKSLVAMYIVAKDPISGVLVKLPGKVTLDQATGRIVSTFQNTPQLAFEDAEIHLFGGERAPLATPAHCGTYTTEATFTPWSGTPAVKSTSSFLITSGPGGGPCPPAALPFSPSLAAGSPNNNAGSFSPLTTTISREDGNQNIQTVQLHMAPGMSGILAGVPLCPDAQANEGTCDPASQIGETIVSVGLGGDPFSVTGGKVYLTEKYQGAPFGLSIVNPADAGPFHLGKVIVRAKIEIDPTTAQLTITTGQIPHILKGIPLQIKHVNVNINRPGFTFNPTNCSPQSITGTIGSVEGASSPVSTAFQVTNCAALKFTPTVAVATAGKASKPNGASLHFKIAYPKGALGTQSWFNEAKFDIPKQLPARLTTIQKACLAATFETNRGACPSASKIGTAIVKTPVLPVPLTGPVYFVSYGGAKFPDAVLVLDGDGVHIELHGETFISGKTGVTSATFRNTPDVPFESIEVNVPTGPFSEFGANLPAKAKYNLCGQKLVMPTLFKAQNGLEIHQNTPVSVTGCPKAKTRAQKLKAALKACHSKHNKAKRAACERQARKKYGPIKKKAKKKG